MGEAATVLVVDMIGVVVVVVTTVVDLLLLDLILNDLPPVILLPTGIILLCLLVGTILTLHVPGLIMYRKEDLARDMMNVLQGGRLQRTEGRTMVGGLGETF